MVIVVAILTTATPRLPAQTPSRGWVSFRNETQTRLISEPRLGTDDTSRKVYAWGDVDHDGDGDVVCARKQAWSSTGRRQNVLLLNEGIAEGWTIDGVLVDRTETFAALTLDANGQQTAGSGFLDDTNDRDVALVDVDLDGWLDIVTAVTTSDGLPKTLSHPRVYRNLGIVQGRWMGFAHEPFRIPLIRSFSGAMFAAPRFAAVAAGDLTGDGFADLFFLNDQTGPQPHTDLDDRLLINDGTGVFFDSKLTRLSAEMLASTQGTSVAMADINGDGTPDIIKCDAAGDSRGITVLANDPVDVGFFRESTRISDGAVLGLALSDVNDDGLTDLMVADEIIDRIWIHQDTIDGENPAFQSHPFAIDGGFGDGRGGRIIIADLNGDGLDDALVTDLDDMIPGCDTPLRLYRNTGGSGERRLQSFSGIVPWTPNGVHDVAVFDINGDELSDMLIGTCRGTEVWIQNAVKGPVFEYPDGTPTWMPPSEPQPFRITLHLPDGAAFPVSDVDLHVAAASESFDRIPATPVDDDAWEVELPPAPCGTAMRWFISARETNGMTWFDPPNGWDRTYTSVVADTAALHTRESFENQAEQWTVVNVNLEHGQWEQVTPRGTTQADRPAAPGEDATRGPQNTRAFVTENAPPAATASFSDVDGGPTYLVSPRMDLSGGGGLVSFAQWFYCDDLGTPEADVLTVEVSNDDGTTWIPVSTVDDTNGRWVYTSFRVNEYVVPTSLIRVRFTAQDQPNNSITEAGIDDFQVLRFTCPATVATLIGSDPPSGSIDARSDFVDPTTPAGWRLIELSFDGDVSGLRPEHLSLKEESLEKPVLGAAPTVIAVEPIDPQTVRVVLSRPIRPGAWTTIQPTGETDSPFVGLVRIGFLPGDVNADRTTSVLDILALIDALNAVGPVPPTWSTDINRSDEANAQDILRLIDLMNGAGDPGLVWIGKRLP